MREQYGDTFRVGIGAEAIKELLTDLDLDALYTELREEIRTTSGQRNIKAVRRMEVVEASKKSKNEPSWMILDALAGNSAGNSSDGAVGRRPFCDQ